MLEKIDKGEETIEETQDQEDKECKEDKEDKEVDKITGKKEEKKTIIIEATKLNVIDNVNKN